MKSHVVQWYDRHDSGRPYHIPDDPHGLEEGHVVCSVIHKPKLDEVVVALLQQSDQHTQRHEDGNSEMVGEHRSHRVDRLE